MHYNIDSVEGDEQDEKPNWGSMSGLFKSLQNTLACRKNTPGCRKIALTNDRYE